MSKERVPYWEKLKDPRWQKKRLELFEAAKWKCQVCECSTKELQVHHKLYLRSTDPWDYEDWAYEVLCKNCHGGAQDMLETAHSAISKNPELLLLCWLFCNESDTSLIASINRFLQAGGNEDMDPLIGVIDSLAAIRGNDYSEGFRRGREGKRSEVSQ
jgi:hypothetical protein